MSVTPLLQSLYQARDRQEVERDAVECSASLVTFIQRGWHVLKPEETYKHNWHIEAIAEKLEAVSAGEIIRLQVWVPPGTMKTMIVSVFWPAWEWTVRPWLRYWTASYEVGLAGRIATMSRDLMSHDSGWYQARWGDSFAWTREAVNYYGNSRGGTRLATAPNSTGSGEHGHRIIIDDPINAKSAEATSRVTLDETNSWYDGTVVTRGIGDDHARVIIMQRLHENDLAAHVLELEDWDVLCLPERYEPSHPFVWPDDPREEDELLWPNHRGEKSSEVMARSLGSKAAGQLQQRPSPKEGDLLKRDWWRFYDSRIREKEEWDQLPKFQSIVISIDSPSKDKETNDNIAIQCWGVKGADRYLLDLRLGKMNYNLAKRQVTEMAKWSRRTWRTCAHYILIENTGYGPELIIDLKREFVGVQKISPQSDGNKETRADSASDALESGNCFVPGYGKPWQPAYDHAKTPSDVAEMIENFARFPNATHDDDVDAWSQAMNWLKARTSRPMRTGSAARQRPGRR